MAEAAPTPAQVGLDRSAAAATGAERAAMENLTPAQIVAELDRYIIGQNDAKRAVAVALRNRYRRQLLPEELRQRGPAEEHPDDRADRCRQDRDRAPGGQDRRCAVHQGRGDQVHRGRLRRPRRRVDRPRPGRDRDQQSPRRADGAGQGRGDASSPSQRLADILAEQLLQKKPVRNGRKRAGEQDRSTTRRRCSAQELAAAAPAAAGAQAAPAAAQRATRSKKRRSRSRSRTDEFGDDYDALDFVPAMSPDDLHDTFQDFLDGLHAAAAAAAAGLGPRGAADPDPAGGEPAGRLRRGRSTRRSSGSKRRRSSSSTRSTRRSRRTATYGGDVSGEGVQRDLLPIVEGSVVMTRYGPVKTDHILFIAAGAFHDTRPSDLIPELQGRFPIRVELSSLTEDDLYAILTEPQNALTKQYEALLATEGRRARSSARTACGRWRGWRRWSTPGPRTSAPGGCRRSSRRCSRRSRSTPSDIGGQTITIDRPFVAERIGEVAADDDLSNFIL